MRVNPWVLFAAVLGVLMLSGRKALAYINGLAVPIDLGPIGGGFYLRRDAAAAFRQMVAQAAVAGVVLHVERAFATMEQQTSYWDLYVSGKGNLAAKPGYSNHQGGIAVDISSFQSTTYAWLAQNAGRFGFVNTGKSFSQPEPWHWEFRP